VREREGERDGCECFKAAVYTGGGRCTFDYKTSRIIAQIEQDQKKSSLVSSQDHTEKVRDQGSYHNKNY